jgi:hypothetical protein
MTRRMACCRAVRPGRRGESGPGVQMPQDHGSCALVEPGRDRAGRFCGPPLDHLPVAVAGRQTATALARQQAFCMTFRDSYNVF